MTALFQSNLLQILSTFLAGAVAYLIGWGHLWRLPRPYNLNAIHGFDEPRAAYLYRIFDLCLALTFIITAFCFLFSLGEFYQYSFFYKRSFGFFGDGFPFVMVLFLSYALRCKGFLKITLCLSVIFMNGSKVVLLLTVIMLLVHTKKTKNYIALRALLAAFFIYWAALFPANYLVGFGYNEIHPPTFIVQFLRSALADIGISARLKKIEPFEGEGACTDFGKCYRTQIANALNQRIATGIAGLWMTAQGGYSGAAFPNTPEKFADLMMNNNPWRVNDILGMSRERWLRAGGVQIAFLNFSSGYGPLGLLAVVVLFGGLSIIALRRMSQENNLPWIALSTYFVLLVFCNQAQPWLQGKSILLFLSGIGAMHIVAIEYNMARAKKLVK